MDDTSRIRIKLADFSRRLEEATRDLRERGTFSDLQRSLLARIQQRRDRIEEKLASAEAAGEKRDMIVAEVERDFGAIFDELSKLEGHVIKL
jgi:hypothetical protein